jgi:hypothetical protein
MGAGLKHKIDVFVTDQLSNENIMYNGSYVYKGGYIIINAHPIPKFDLRMLFAHEMTHAFQAHNWNSENINLTFGPEQGSWVNEGMAEYIAKQVVTYSALSIQKGKMTEYNLEVKDYINRIQSFQNQYSIDLSLMDSWPKVWYPNDYIVYESIIFFFEKQYGHDKLMEWIQLVSDGKNLSIATDIAFGKTEKELVKEWKTYFSIK